MPQSGPALITLLYAVAGVAWILASGSLLALVIEDQDLLAWLEVGKGLAFIAVTSGVLYFLLRRRRDAGVPAHGTGPRPERTGGWYGLAMAAMAVSVPIIGGSAYLLHARQAERDALGNLEVIAEFKVRQLENWLAERHGDASVLAESDGFIERIQRLRATGDRRERELVQNRLAAMRKQYAYDAINLYDEAQRPLISIGKHALFDVHELEFPADASGSRRPRMSDLHLDGAGGVHLHFTVPMTAGGALVATAILHIDAEQFLLPLVRAWPTASASGETLLVRRDGDDVLYLNELRNRKDTALSVRQPIASEALPVAMALRAMAAGTGAGTDYKGVPVLAAWRPVAGTGWMLVTKLARAEALAPARMLAAWLTGVAALAAALVAAILFLLAREQRHARELARDAEAGRLSVALEAVALLPEVESGDLDALAPRVTEAAANTAGAARANLWLFNESETQLRCIDHFDAVGGKHSSGAVLEETQYRSEFQALKSAAYVNADDALSDPRTAGYAEGYLKPLGITSMLDAVVTVSGRHLGLLCIEHVGRRHSWTSEEIAFASRLADRVALAIVNRDRRQAQRALRSSHALLENTERLAGIGGWTMDLVNDAVLWSDETYRICGFEPGSVVRRRDFVDVVHPEDRARVSTTLESALAGARPEPIEIRILRRDGDLRVCRVHGEVARDAQGRPARVTGTLHDITALKAAESRVLQLNRLYLTLSRCNVAMVRSRSEQEMFEEVCRVVVQTGGMGLASVGLEDPATRLVKMVARFGSSDAVLEYADGIRVSADPGDSHGSGPTGTAIREGVPFWCQDFEADPRTVPWRESARRFGWRASAALPLRRAGQPVGALTFYMTEPNAFDEETRNLLSEIAADISFGMDNFDREAARRAATTQLEASEERHRLLFENSLDGILLTAPDGRILSANPAACRIFQATEAQIVAGGRNAIVELSDPRLQAALEERARTGSFRGEITMVRKDGKRFPANVSTTVFRDHSGEARSSMIIRDISEEKRNVERLAHLAQHDALTDLPNRLLLTDRLGVALARAQRSSKPLAVLFLDLDRFKNVNDSLGHEQGDRLLVEAAARLKACVRASDTVSRQGGDEFLVVLPEIDSAQDAARVAAKLIEAVSQPFVLGGTEYVLTGSIGIACWPENGADAESLLRNADAAMYAAKQAGRNRYQFYSTEMNARAHDRLLLEADLRHAIERHELFVAYQPQVDLRTGAPIGAEALLRWQHPRLGLVPPGEFIGIAEDSGQIVAIGAWVLEAACRQQAAWIAGGLSAGFIAVNVSAHQFRQPEFVATVERALAQSGLPGDRLELEVTESVMMQGADLTLRKLEQLDRLGIRLAIDDFGTGYSSLSYLKQFPIDRLKIDQSFTHGLPGDRQSAAISQAVIALGHSLGLSVLAEGIENAEQEAHLRDASCDAGQGYLYAKPMEAQAYAGYLRERAPGRA